MNKTKHALNKQLNLLILLLTVFTLASCNATPTTPLDDPELDKDAIILHQGEFQDADPSHKGSGQMSILEQNNERTLRFENFSSTNGPDLKVVLVENIAGTKQAELGEHLNLGKLKSTNGNQNYAIPEDADLSNYTGVIIYCEAFHVVFSRAAFK